MMKNKKKKKINIFKTISSLKKDLLNPKILSNNFITNQNINNKSGTHSSKLSHKIEIINNITTENEENAQVILENLFKEELNKFKIIDSKKEKLKNINLKEENANDLYNWNALLNRKIPFSKRKEYNMTNPNRKLNSSHKIDYNTIDYTKGVNVVSQISNEALLNFYKDILKYRKNASELTPKIKIQHKNNISNLINTQRISYSDKEKILNFLTLKEKVTNKFSDHDLKIAAKRKTADVLIKAIISNNKIIENNKENLKNNDIIKSNNKKRKKIGLILSLYDENNPEIIKFNEKIHSLSEQNKNKTKSDIFDELLGEVNSNNHRNFFSAKNLKGKGIKMNNLHSDQEGFKNYSSGTTNFSINGNEIHNKRNKLNFFKENEKKIENNHSVKLNSNKQNKTIKKDSFRQMSSSNLLHSEKGKINFLKNKPNKRSLSYEEYDEIGFFNNFPRKQSSKVGNSLYDKINTILKHRILKKYKLNSKTYSKNLISKTINNKYNKKKEESKSNKLIQTFLSENLRTSISKTTESDMLNSISKYKENERLSSGNENSNKLNKKTKNFYSCSNNYIVNIKRKNKIKFLNEINDRDYLNEMMNEIIFEDNFIQKESNERIKSIYNYNE